jgi:cyanophycinase
MGVPLQPIYLFADSQLLFWRIDGVPFLQAVRDRLPTQAPRAGYIGASNGDAPEFYEMFQAAMESVGIHDCRQIHASFDPDDAGFLNTTDLILLAGGDVEAGWNILSAKRMADVIANRYSAGAALIGISAGAVQLGMWIPMKTRKTTYRLIDALKLVPFVLDVHNEHLQWSSLDTVVKMLAGTATGLGIPAGGGLIYHPDGVLEAVRLPAYVVSVADRGLRRQVAAVSCLRDPENKRP